MKGVCLFCAMSCPEEIASKNQHMQNIVVHSSLSMQIGSLSVKCLSTPCHTSGHICYLVSDNGESKAIFTGRQCLPFYCITVYIII